MKRKRLHYLMTRYLAQECTAEEKKELALLIDEARDEDLQSQLLDQWNSYDSKSVLSTNKAQQIVHSILASNDAADEITLAKNKPFIVRFRTIAAVAACVVILFSLGLFLHRSNNSGSEQIVAKTSIVSPQQPTPFIRNIVLSDGSTVVLRAGSTINYPQKFTGKTREITLVGEAYFDIKHDSKKPFIIHTGNVKTTVLGTAFDIKAWPKDRNITVSVTRGKVRVEDDKKVLAVLTINQQINYDLQSTTAKHQRVNGDEIVSNWAKQDLDFDGVTLESIAQVLSKRYGKNISITNSQLARTQIVSSFVGTESLENILDILCTINSNAQFVERDNEIIISYKN